MVSYLGRVDTQDSLVTVVSGTNHVIGIAFAIYSCFEKGGEAYATMSKVIMGNRDFTVP